MRKRWLYLAVSTLMLLFCGMIYGWSMFRGPIGEIFPTWSMSQLSLTFTLSMSSFCIAGYMAGKLRSRISLNTLILTAGLTMFAGFAVVSGMNPDESSKSLTMLYIGYGILGGAGVGAAYNCIVSAMNQCFQDKQGLASGIMMMGFGMGAVLLGGITEKLFESQGVLRTFLLIGVAILLIFSAGAYSLKGLAKNQSSIESKSEEREKDGLASMSAEKNIRPSEMVRTAEFWIFFLWLILLNASGLMVINSAASIAKFYGAAAIAGMSVSAFNGLGRILAGCIFDRTNRNATMLYVVCMLAAGGGFLTMGACGAGEAAILAGLSFIGLAFGGGPTILSSYMNSTFGPKFFSINFGLGSFSVIPAVFLATNLSTYLLEKSGGSYFWIFLSILFFAAAALGIWKMLCRDKKGNTAEKPEGKAAE